MYLLAEKGLMYNNENKRIGIKAKEERADVWATQTSVVVT